MSMSISSASSSTSASTSPASSASSATLAKHSPTTFLPTPSSVNSPKSSSSSQHAKPSPSPPPHHHHHHHRHTSSSSSTSTSVNDPPDTVYLNVYDVLTPSDAHTIPRMNDVLLHCGIGIFHTGLQVWGREFAFGGHSEIKSGIFEVSPRQCPSVRYRTTLTLGRTSLSEPLVMQLVHALGVTEYLGLNYSLVAKNCNTFSKHLAELLGVHTQFPVWVNRLAGMAVNFRCILPEPLFQPLSDSVPRTATNPTRTPMLKEPQKPPPVATL